MMRCPGCFKEIKPADISYCRNCLKRLFDGKKISFNLPFSRPAYERTKLETTADRMSISGIQTKISLAIINRELQMVEPNGEYILKPRPYGVFQRLEAVPINEHLTMQIARQVFNIKVAENALVEFEGRELAYLVRRFDIQKNGRRSLQEDFAQIAARTPDTHGKNYKYDFSYEEIGELIHKNVSTYKIDLERYFKLVLFNYLIHNGDAHVKNFSLIRSDQTNEYNLTPAYDLLNTRLHSPNESRTALTLFKDGFETESYKKNGFYAYDDFMMFARKLGLVESRYRRILEEFITKQDTVVSFVEYSLLPNDCKQLYKNHVKESVEGLSYSFSGWRDRQSHSESE